MLWFILLVTILLLIFSIPIYFNFQTAYAALKTKNKLLRIVQATFLAVFFSALDMF